jgi:Fe-S cluster assembly protein SufD
MGARASGEPAWLTTARRAALTRFQLLGFPTARNEEWRFTPLAPLVETSFQPAANASAAIAATDLAPFVVRGIGATYLVFVNGRYAGELSAEMSEGGRSVPGGVLVSPLAAALDRAETASLLERHLARYAPFSKEPFTALNTAFVEDGAVVSVPNNIVLPGPVWIVYYSTASSPTVSHPRTLVVAGANSQATIIETYAGAAGDQYFTNAVTEIAAGENAHLQHYRVQRESRAAYHVAATRVQLARNAVFAQQNFMFGGAIARSDVSAKLDDEGIECTLNGLYLGDGERLVDNHTAIDHAQPHCASHEIYKGMLDGRARGVFNGKIFVRQDAQKTDAKQTNQVLLLSDDATINTKPQLEIFADDVKCTHGATVGQIDAEALFYLRARGIGEAEARALLVHAFASDIIDRVTIEPLREQLEAALLGYLGSKVAVTG